MNILLVDANADTHKALMEATLRLYTQDEIADFADPLLALKHGANHPVDVLLLQPEIRIRALAGTITRNLREYHPAMRVVFATRSPKRRITDFDEPPDAVVQFPITVEKLKLAIRPDDAAAKK